MVMHDLSGSRLAVDTSSVLRRTTQVLVAVWVALAAGQVASVVLRYGLDRANAFGIVPLLDLNQESSVGTWVAAMLLSTCAVLSAAGAVAASGPDRRWRSNWILMSVVFLALSVDEVGAVHDRLTPYLRSALGGSTGVLYFAWVLPALVLGLAFLLVQLRFLRHLGRTGTGLALAGIVYVSGAAGFEMAQGVLKDDGGTGSPYAIFPTIEELLEFAGTMLVVRVLLRHLLMVLPRTVTVALAR